MKAIFNLLLLAIVVPACASSSKNHGAYRVGEKIDPAVQIGRTSHYRQTSIAEKLGGPGEMKSKSGKRVEYRPLSSLLQSGDVEAKVICLAILGGAHGSDGNNNGGVWCADTYHEFPLYRKLIDKYAYQGVEFYFVFCPPVYSDGGYGDARAKFFDPADKSKEFYDAGELFIQRMESVLEREKFPVNSICYDPQFRLLMNRTRPLPEKREVESWEGRFKADGDQQKYGTPTIWLLSRGGTVLAPPFYGNNYPDNIRYTFDDVDRAIQSAMNKD